MNAVLVRFLSVLIFFAGFSPLQSAWAAASEINQQRANALFNLVLFIDWPDTHRSNGEFRFCTLPGQPLNEMQAYDDRSVHKLPFRMVALSPDLDTLPDCHVVYSGNTHPDKLNKILAAAKNQALLIVFEGKHALEMGAMIGIELNASQILLDINLNALQQSRLHAHAQLLSIARRVVR